MKHKQNAKVFKALCDEKRLAILEFLATGEKCACMIEAKLQISQSAVSYHMRILCQSGIVVGNHSGKWTNYSISEEGADRAKNLLSELTTMNEIIKDEAC